MCVNGQSPDKRGEVPLSEGDCWNNVQCHEYVSAMTGGVMDFLTIRLEHISRTVAKDEKQANGIDHDAQIVKKLIS